MRAGSALDDLRLEKQEQYDSLNIQVRSPACKCLAAQKAGETSVAQMHHDVSDRQGATYYWQHSGSAACFAGQ